ncbi:MFS transporter [Salmonella enterica]|nr:MFS transporter [Salmonella enterica]
MTYRSKVAVVYLLGFFLDLINLFIASVAFPAMSVDLHTSISALAWVSNGYIAGLTLIVPFSAFLSRYLGARRLIIFSLILFSVAAAAAGFADSLHSLVFWRIVQGAGALMLPWSIASFVAIMLTGRYFNRLGPRPFIIVGCLLQAAGILLLTNVTPATSHRVLMMIFALMGAGGSLCNSTEQSGAFLTIARRDMPDASALWNLNRQLSFFIGATLLTLLLNALQRVMSLEVAYRWTFIAAAGITLLPLIYAVCLNNRQALLCLKKERS